MVLSPGLCVGISHPSSIVQFSVRCPTMARKVGCSSGPACWGLELAGLCCCSAIRSYLTLCNPMDCSMPGFLVLHYLLELAQTHVHWIVDAIQPSRTLSSSSSPAFSLSQHHGLSQRVSCLHHVAKVLELRFSISPSNDYSGLTSFRADWFDLLIVQRTL